MMQADNIGPETRLALLALVNFALCMALAQMSLCRMARMSGPTTRRPVRLAYAVLFTTAVAVGTMPWWSGIWPSPGGVALCFSYCIVMYVNRRQWAEGIPTHARTAPGAFDDAPHHHIAHEVKR